MNKPIPFSRIGFDLLQAQLIWTLWYLGILVLVNIVRLVFSADEIDTFYNHAFVASNVYMLVIGIISIYFLPYFVENGITRKNYFYGNIIASICLSILIPIIAYVITIFEGLVLSNLKQSMLHAVPDPDTNFIGDIFQSILLTPHVDMEANLLLSLGLFSINIFGFYLIGWLIGTAFYRLGVIGGLCFIAISLLIIVAKDSFLRIAMDHPLFESFSIFEAVPESMALVLVFIILLVPIFLIRLLTKRAPVKI
ncbi:hypothetical protein M3210_04305 [Oceanobacillus luteolus]|uniref:hypothetical protein n=1 Tax=Oceanobacillus luteolus TaxID=1274358 RepID=UPI00203B4F70|nr:hypothetical protein [Oceanobacillus luteolus]MCM3739486.1 hypothetical protein [Oceanobacillus luteolus]